MKKKKRPAKIIDEFTDLPVSRQYKHMLRKNKAGLCRLCDQKMVSGGFCLNHLVKKREHTREKIKTVKRNTKSLSYRLEEAQRKIKKKEPKNEAS